MDKNALWVSLWTADVSRVVKSTIRTQAMVLGRSVQDCEDAYSQAMFVSWQRVLDFNPHQASFATWASGIAKTYMYRKQHIEITVEPFVASEMPTLLLARGERVSKVRLLSGAPRPSNRKHRLIYDYLKTEWVESRRARTELRAVLKSNGFSSWINWRNLSFVEAM